MGDQTKRNQKLEATQGGFQVEAHQTAHSNDHVEDQDFLVHKIRGGPESHEEFPYS